MYFLKWGLWSFELEVWSLKGSGEWCVAWVLSMLERRFGISWEDLEGEYLMGEYLEEWCFSILGETE